eukprot:TRINITY_DN12901_c2_g2_i1.p1 TRINITY_DN12901_c2_g2~~TRINITY_DN12901_c2_g2_i1.p1  ORF type:complete len:433 (+),score=71.01 TRINITY_DN12901_c2_g2_i1:78-1301(+)
MDGDEDWDNTGTPQVDAARIFLTLVALTFFVLVLPDAAACHHQGLWDLREKLRENLYHILELSLQGPVFKAIAFCVRKVSGGLFYSKCRPPVDFQAKVIGRGAVLVRWKSRPPPLNPFHEEYFVCSWLLVADANGASVVDIGKTHKGSPDWKLRAVTDNLFKRETFVDPLCWVSVLEGLPETGILRLRVRAQHCNGHSSWAREEVELDMSRVQGEGSEGVVKSRPSHRSVGANASTVGGGGGYSVGAGYTARSRLNTLASRNASGAGGRPCLRCRLPQAVAGSACGGLFADVVTRPLFGKECPHGPFCARCRHRVGAQALPSCVCRALVGSWREGEAKPSPSPIEANCGPRESSNTGDNATTTAHAAGGAEASTETATNGACSGGRAADSSTPVTASSAVAASPLAA